MTNAEPINFFKEAVPELQTQESGVEELSLTRGLNTEPTYKRTKEIVFYNGEMNRKEPKTVSMKLSDLKSAAQKIQDYTEQNK